MRRRQFLSLAAAAIVIAIPRAALSQQAARLPRLAFFDTPRAKYQLDGFFLALPNADIRRWTGESGVELVLRMAGAPEIRLIRRSATQCGDVRQGRTQSCDFGRGALLRTA